MNRTNGQDYGGILNKGWGGLDWPRLPRFMAGVHGQQPAEPAAEPGPLSGYAELLKEASEGSGLYAQVARALLEPATATKAHHSRLYRRVGAALAGRTKTKDVTGVLSRRIADVLK